MKIFKKRKTKIESLQMEVNRLKRDIYTKNNDIKHFAITLCKGIGGGYTVEDRLIALENKVDLILDYLGLEYKHETKKERLVKKKKSKK